MWNENLREYQESWNQELEKYNIADRPNDLILETLYEAQIRRCKHFEEDLKMFQIRIEMGNVTKNYHTLHEAVDNYIKKSKQKRNDALANKQRQGPTMLAAAKSPGDCSQYYYNGACSNIGKCPYEHSNCGGKGLKKKGKGKGKGKDKDKDKDSRSNDGNARKRSSDRRTFLRKKKTPGSRKLCLASGGCNFGKNPPVARSR